MTCKRAKTSDHITALERAINQNHITPEERATIHKSLHNPRASFHL